MSLHPAPTATNCSRNIALAKTGADKFREDKAFTAPDRLPAGPDTTDDITAKSASRPQMFDGTGTRPANEGPKPFAKK